MASSVDGGLSIGKTLQADGASPDNFRGLSEDNFRFTVARADRGLLEGQKEGYLRRPVEDPLRSTEGRLKLTEDQNKQMALGNRLKKCIANIAKVLPFHCHLECQVSHLLRFKNYQLA